MTPPCRNCHGGASTSAYSQENWVYHHGTGPLPESFTPLQSGASRVCKKECSARDYWLEALETSVPELQSLPFWVRGNFEKTLQAMRRAQDKSVLPFRIDIGHAEVEVELYPHSASSGIPGPADLHLDAADDAVLRSHLQIDRNRLNLFLKSLVEFHGIELGIGTPRLVSLSPEKIATDNAGQLHFLSSPSWGVRRVLDFIGPIAPNEFRYPRNPGCQYFWQFQPTCPDPTRQSGYPEDDLLLTSAVPEGLRHPASGTLPASWNLEDLALKIMDVLGARKKSPPPKEESAFQWGNLLRLQNLKMGSRLILELQELRDLFVPGLLDLGPSRGKVQLFRDLGDTLRLIVDDLELQVEPMDYGKAAPGKRGPIQLHGAKLNAGPQLEDDRLGLMKSGLQATYHELSGTVELAANLKLAVQAKVPLLGEIEFSGQILFKGQLEKTPQGWRLDPNFQFALRQGELKGGKSTLLSHLDFSLGVHSIKFGPFSPQQTTVQASPTADFIFIGKAAGKFPVQGSGQIFFNLDEQGRWDLSEWGMNSSFDVEHAAPGKIAVPKMIEGGKLFFHKAKLGSDENPLEVVVRMNRFYFPTPAGPLTLEALKAQLSLDPFVISENHWNIGVENFSLEANPVGTRHGLVQGKVSLRQSPKTHMSILFFPPLRQATLHNLDLALNAQQITFLPPKLRELLDSAVAGWGVDGHLAGHFTMNFPENPDHWNGSGKIGLEGDPGGDVYFLDARGNRVGPPLLRNTRWEIHRIDRVNLKRQYALGKFFLLIEPNVGALSLAPHRPPVAGPAPVFFGGLGQRLHPSGDSFVMPYDNMPFTPKGFFNFIADYLVKLCHQDPDCRAKVQKRGQP